MHWARVILGRATERRHMVLPVILGRVVWYLAQLVDRDQVLADLRKEISGN
jgi:hypothetical protein